jgi:8-amino-7-oxononanoate synthase
VPVRTFLHHDVDALAQLASNAAEENLKPVVVADGYCPRCAETAPVGAYGEIARRCNGYLVVDDTQALGILGESPSPANPYGKGGGGSLRWHQTFGRHIVVGSSLAKGLGVSVAVLAGSGELIDRFRRESETRIHCSPPSVVMIRAAQRALQANQRHGETLRRRLMKLVVRLRQWLIQAGLAPAGRMPFPVQTFLSARQQPAATLHEQLLRVGVAGLLTNACQTRTASLTLLVTARHQFAEIEHAGRAVAHVARSVTADFDHYMRPGRSRHRFAGDASKDLVRAS